MYVEIELAVEKNILWFLLQSKGLKFNTKCRPNQLKPNLRHFIPLDIASRLLAWLLFPRS